MGPPKWMFLITSLVIGAALYSPISDIIRGKFDFGTIIEVIVGAIAAVYFMGIFIGMECEERKNVRER